jgi:hypothetical protein
MQDLMNEYNQERYAWYDFEDDFDDWYMDSCHFWDDNHFHILFDDSTPPSREHHVSDQELVTNCILVYYSFKILLNFSTRWIFLFGT